MKFLSGLLVAVLMLASAHMVSAQTVNWANSILPGSNGSISDAKSVTDAAGNTYAAFEGSGTVILAGQTYGASDSLQHINIITYSPSGAVIDVKRIFPQSTIGFLDFADLELDAVGNLYILGSVYGNLLVDSTLLFNPTANKYFIAKWNPAGTLVTSLVGGSSAVHPADLAVDQNRQLYITGYVNGQAQFGNISFPATNNRAFVAKLDSTGGVEWVTGPTTSSSMYRTQGQHLALDAAGNIYTQGEYTFDLFWGNQTLAVSAPSQGLRAYWVKLNNVGQPIASFSLDKWVNLGGHLVVDGAGFSYISDVFNDTINLGGINLSHTGFGDGVYLAKYDPNGVLQWGSLVPGTASDHVSLALDGAGKVYWSGGSFLTNVAEFDAMTGALLWNTESQTINYNISTGLSAGINGTVSLVGIFTGDTLTIGGNTVPSPSQFFSQYGYVYHFLHNHNTITGLAFIDQNLNNVQDSGESGYPLGAMVEITPGPTIVSASNNGFYAGAVAQGTFDITMPNPPLYYNAVAAGPTQATFQGFGNISSGHNFALQPIPNQLDLRVIVTPLLPARPGFATAYRITYTNVGTVAMPSGTVTLSFDPQFTYLSSTPAGTISGTSLTWSYTNLLPGQTRNINVNLSLPTSAVVGNLVTATASIFPVLDDLTPADNSETNTRPITASYDPNIIEVNHEELALQQVQNGQWLEYTIRFQNQGSDTAFTVMIRDSLQANMYKMGTISLLGASHSCSWSVNSAGVMTILFTNIRLPNQAANVLGSHGFIRFRIKPQNTLNVGAIIPNRARIYFDYNPAIITNLAETEVVQQVSAEAELTQTNWQLFPNPAADIVRVKALSGRFAGVNLRLLNALGQEVYSRRITRPEEGLEQEINLRHLPSGIYSVQLQTEQGSVVKRLVKQ